MQEEREDNPKQEATKQREKVPAYLRWLHLADEPGAERLPNKVTFLVYIVSLTDSVISFNETKRLTNTLEAVIKAVSHLAKQGVCEKHYRQIKYVFGDVYKYTAVKSKGKEIILMEKTEMGAANRLLYCRREAKKKLAVGQVEEEPLICREDQNAPDQEVSLTKITVRDDIEEKNRDKTLLLPAPSTTCTPTAPSTPRAASILERIRKREEERKKAFIAYEKEKDEEVRKTLHTLYMLYLSEDRKVFEAEILQKSVPALSSGRVSLDLMLKHPDTSRYLKIQNLLGKKYLGISMAQYKADTEAAARNISKEE